MSLQISSITTEYVKVPTRALISGEPADVTLYEINMAFTEEGEEPGDLDWFAGDWEVWPDNFFMARRLVGPESDVELVDGVYDIWVNVITPQENVKRRVDKLVVT